MGTEKEARALAAGETIEVNGKEYKLRPIVAQVLSDLEREALRYWKRQYLETYTENADLLSDGKADELIERKMDEAAQWDLTDLPQKDAFDLTRVPASKDARLWAEKKRGEELSEDNEIKAVLSVALDTGELKPEDVEKMTGRRPVRGRVRYDQWWVTATMTGMIAFITAGVNQEHPKLSRKEVGKWPFSKIAEAARITERLTSADVGNI
jgi:hypothetical protein